MQHSGETTISGDARRGMVVVELPLGDASSTFNLEKAVCSHGLFMMAPNHWDPLTKTLERPLRLSDDHHCADHEISVTVRVSHPSDSPQSLRLHVFGTDCLSAQQHQSLMAQVRRMLRLSEEEEKMVREFQEMYGEAKERGFGRVFRSPILFEDMVKCILLCNCQWSRTLSMAKALCELQLELSSSDKKFSLSVESDHFIPKTPAAKEKRKKAGVHKCSKNLSARLAEAQATTEEDNILTTGSAEIVDCPPKFKGLSSKDILSDKKEDFLLGSDISQPPSNLCSDNPCSSSDLHSAEAVELNTLNGVGNFPSPRELAELNESFLAKRCNLGYRAGRIINLARGVVEGRIPLKEIEECCSKPNVSNYDELARQLKEIDGFGPFTCANVLMCLGYYHVIPTDSETIRHLKQVHAKSSSILTVQKDVEAIYGKYAPFQFLVYWSEIWHFYEEWFGKLSEMPQSGYNRITASNMRPKRNAKSKRIKTSA
nr:uncharacterized protein LOC109185598 [Ipomoea batatas]